MTYRPYQQNHIIYNTLTLEWVDGYEHKGTADVGLKARMDRGEKDLAVTSPDRLVALRKARTIT